MRRPGFADCLDVLFVSSLIYAFLIWFKRTKAAFVAMGLLIVAALYAAAELIGMRMTVDLFQGFFAVFIIAIVVIFQEELRQAFERLAVMGFRRNHKPKASSGDLEVLLRTVRKFAAEKTGALIVLEGKDPLARHLDAGWDLNGRISEALLESIFDWHSLGHDGAVVIAGGLVTRFGCHLPLSKEEPQLAGFGTRHAAALGLAERSDALVIVVSEEKGSVAVAERGEIASLRESGEIEGRLERFFEDKTPKAPAWHVRQVFSRNLPEKAISLGIAILLWIALSGLAEK